MVSLIGSWTQTTALMWLAFELTHQSKWPAFISAAQIGPTFLFGPIGGWFSDRVPKRTLIISTQFGYLVIASLLTICVFVGWTSPWLLLSMSLCNGLIQAMDLPARLSFVPNLVPKEDLINAVALNSLLFNVARSLGPALAGVLLVTSGAGVCILVNALSYGAVLWALMQMDFPPEPIRDGPRERNHPWSGFVILWQQPKLGLLILLAGAMALFGWPVMTLLPAYSANVLHADEATYSLLLSTIGAGALCGALSVARYGAMDRRWRFLMAGGVIVCVGLTGLANADTRWIAGASCAVFGYGMILFFATGQSTVQLSTTDSNRGRVMGIWAMMLSGGVPIGNLIFGPIADDFGVVRVLTVQAIVVGMLTMVLVAFRLRTRMNRRALTVSTDAVK